MALRYQERYRLLHEYNKHLDAIELGGSIIQVGNDSMKQ